jgi:hypothetical protein
MNQNTIRIAAAALSLAVTFTLLKGVGFVADAESAAGPSATRLAHAERAASAPLQVATLRPDAAY